mgnify:CR=1 FL=1
MTRDIAAVFKELSLDGEAVVRPLGRALGHPVTIFMPDWMSRERVDLIHGLGATIVRDDGPPVMLTADVTATAACAVGFP